MQKLFAIILIALVGATVVVGAIVYHQFTYPVQTSTHSICGSCFLQTPVGDVIISSISEGSGGGVANIPVNMTLGQSLSLTVSLYLTINANVSSALNILAGPGGTTQGISATFEPENLDAVANQNASTVMTMKVASNAQIGSYSTVLVFTDQANRSYTWGSQIQINVKQ
ncbi:MAG: hypothetical protein ACYCQJ_09280 [Nitrososphaerales archaeon]